MLRFQNLVRMFIQHLINIGGVVLAAQRQDEPALLKIEQSALEGHVGVARILVAKRDAVEAVLTDDAAPQRVVGVERYNFRLRELQGSP